MITAMTSDAPATSVENVEEENELDLSSFEALLDSYDYDQPRRGETLVGLVLEITDDQVILDVGTKRDAIVPRSDLDRLDPKTLERVKPGAEISVVVLRPLSKDGELLVSINKALTIEDWDEATKLSESTDVIEVEVIGQNKGGVLVDFGRLRGFIPNSQLCEIPRGASSDRATDIKTKLIGSKLMVKVIEVNQRRNRLVMSETAAQRSVRKECLSELEIGEVVKGKVVGLVDYGAFVDIGNGVHGLIHISKLDWQHVNHPSEVLTVGDDVEVRIDQIDIERERISLNRKAVVPDPWEAIEEQYAVGSLVTGSISSVAEYGIFLDLPNGVTGLAHVSEMTSFNIQDPRKWAQEGEDLLVRVINIDTERKRIGLSLDAVTHEEFTDWMIAHGEQSSIARLTESAQAEEDQAGEEASIEEPEMVEEVMEAEAVMEAEVESEEVEAETVIEAEAEIEVEAEAEEAEAVMDAEAAVEAKAEAEIEVEAEAEEVEAEAVAEIEKAEEAE